MDENSIMITLQFYFYCDKSKTGSYEYKTYDFDLIAPNSISCDELYEAIQYGLENKLKDENDITVVKSAYDNRYCFTVSETLEGNSYLDYSKHTKEQMMVLYSNYSEVQMLAICRYIFLECAPLYCKKHTSFPDKTENSESISTNNRIGIASVNPRKYKTVDALSYSHNDQIWLNHYEHGIKTLNELGFISSTRVIFDVYNAHGGRFLFSEDDISVAFKDDIPEYNISDRPIYELDIEPVNIIPPSDPPKRSRQNFIATLLSPLLMMGSILVVRLFSSSGMGFELQNTIIMSGTMIAATVLVGIVNWSFQKKSHREAVEEWREEYQNYIKTLIEEIKARQKSDTAKLHELFPPVYEADYSDIRIGGLIEKTIHLNGDIFGRSRKHPDFLKVRLGTTQKGSGLVPSVFKIVGEKKDVLFSAARYKNLNNDGKYGFFISLKDKIKDTDGALVDLPSDLAKKYSYLDDAPVTLNLKECGTLGIVRQKSKNAISEDADEKRDLVHALLDNIILDLCFHHNPGDLQICLFFNETKWMEQQKLINKFKHLPHFRELLGGFSSATYKDDDAELNEISQFAFDKESAGLIFDRILEIVTRRKTDEKADRFPNIVLIFINEYQFKTHQLSEYLYDIQSEDDSRDDFGLFFLFCAEYFEKLPKYCGQIIEIKSKIEHEDKCLMRSVPHVRNLENKKNYNGNGEVQYYYNETLTIDENRDDQYSLVSDTLSPTESLDDKKRRDNYYRAFKILSALYYFRIAQGAGVPNLVELIKLHELHEKLIEEAIKHVITEETGIEAEVLERRDDKKNDICTTVIDLKSDCVLEIREKQKKRDVTKSLAVPIGFKSGSEKVYLDLHEKHDGPHMLVAGTTGSGKSEAILTYLIGLCMCYTPEQVNLLLIDMKGGDFIRRIGKLPHVVGTVSDIDSVTDDGGTDSDSTEYMLSRFLRSMKAEIKRRKKLFKDLNVKDIDDYIKAKKNKPEAAILPHLFLVVDEFTELMQFSEDNPNIDFKKEISSLARIGRSLGFHIILISQNIEGAITDNIRVNSRARLCLKVATKEASKEMIDSEAAADPLMPGFGRGFLYVGNGARSDYFQAAYSGASAMTNSKQRVLIPLVKRSGKYSVFYNSYVHNEKASNEKKKADIIGTQIEWLADFVCGLSEEFIDDTRDLPHQVLRPLLQSMITQEKEDTGYE